MANELRVRQNFLGGLIDTADLADEAGPSTMNSSALAAVPAIGSTQHYPIVLDPDVQDGAPEIGWISAHTANATTATLLRAQEGTTRRLHRIDTPWVHGPVVSDFNGDSAWTAPTLGNSWVNYGGAYAVAGFRKFGDGLVMLKGMIKDGTISSTIFTLPVGYRPLADHIFPAVSNSAIGQIYVLASGAVQMFSASNAYVTLDGVRFLAEQ